MDVFIGEIALIAFNYPPPGWAVCDGQTLLINQHSSLFALIGTTFGGDGTKTFALPNLQGRVPIHAGQGPGLSPYTPGQSGGEEQVILDTTTMPAHTHAGGCHAETGSSPSPINQLWAGTSTGERPYTYAEPDSVMGPGSIGFTGGGLGHPNLQPYLVLNYIIALTGTYPPRN
jgi:microcystin-dependent protein